MDGDEDDVVVGIDEFYHLLRTAVDFGAEESGETSHSVVEVDYVVARFDGSKLLEREGEFAGAGAVALEGVFVEAVENLMVGEDAHPGFGVAETLVECGEYRGERDGVAAVSEDGPQSLDLFLGVA